VGRLLSLALLPVVGSCFLFLGQQLCHGGLWRRSAAVELADVGTVGEHHRCIDVRNIRERSLYYGHPPSGPRCPILGQIDDNTGRSRFNWTGCASRTKIVVSLVNKAKAPYRPSAKKKTLHAELDLANCGELAPRRCSTLTKNALFVEMLAVCRTAAAV
jgi:hypothetical protein